LLPCLWALWVTATAVSRYIDGEPGGIKMGVDLEGGTILVYEIDVKKKTEGAKDEVSKTNLLAEALKRRIDPNDLKNIVIRSAGENRVEIILPTGGVYRTQKAEEAWKKLKDDIGKEWGVDPGTLTVDRGNPDELADKIQLELSQKTWEKTFADPSAWKKMVENSYGKTTKEGEWPGLGGEGNKEIIAKLNSIKPGDTAKLIEVLQTELRSIGTNVSETDLKNWIKREAWKAMLDKVLIKWPELEPYKEGLYAIRADNHDQLIGFIYCKGNVMSQAFVTMLAPALGDDDLATKDFGTREEITEFIKANYGPSLSKIRVDIRKRLEDTNRTQDLTVEEVQRIKDLVSKVGSLEFLMLANGKDDEKAEVRMKEQFADPASQAELAELQKDGLPPFGPRKSLVDKSPEVFTVTLPHDNKCLFTYRWVELGPQERKSLNLDNAAEFEKNRNETWSEAWSKRGQATQLHSISTKKTPLLQGALFYSRECLNRNLPEDERRAKKIEYFVLARNPEIDPTDPEQKKQTPSITGALLLGAQSGQGQDLRPAVHFTFGPEGGRLFGDLTRKNVPSDKTGDIDSQVRRHLAIVLDGLVMSAPHIMSQITTNGQISGGFTQKEVTNLVNILNSGSLPATLKPQPVSESMMGPTLGLDTIKSGVLAIIVAFTAVLVFMCVYYRFAGLVASIALLANLLLTVGFMIGVQATFTLPGLAGLVLMVGMAVDANVLIYERLREERERGASLALSIRNGYDRALPIIIDTHLTGIFTAVVLYVVGNDQLRGFGVSLTVGLIISLFTSLFMTRLMFDFWLHKNWLHKLSMLKMFDKPNIDFMGIRNAMFAATISLAVLGVGLFIYRGTDGLNIDFTGGTAFGGKLIVPQDMAKLRELVDEAHQKEMLGGVKVKKIEGSGGNGFELQYPGEKPRTVTLVNPPDVPDQIKAVENLASRLPDPSVEQIFPGSDEENAKFRPKSKYFIIRTSEKEPEMVQAVLDRLLSVKKDGNLVPLMDRIYVKMESVDKTNALNRRLHFYKSEPPSGFNDAKDLKEPEKDQLHTLASPSFVKTLIARHLKEQFAGSGEKPPEFDVSGEGGAREGRYSVMNFTMKSEVVKGLTDRKEDGKVLAALQRAVDEFQARPQPDRLETFDSQLATETQYRAMAAIIASWGAILVYLWFRFGSWTFGLAAVICLIHDLFFTLGAIAACHFVDNTFIGHIFLLEDFKIDLPAVAALLTLIGYSVNDTIVVFDRIREIRGKNPDLTSKMINDSVNQTLSRTLLTSLATWLVVIVLYIWGGPGVHLFAFVMVVGVIVGTYSSIYIASPLLLMFGEGVHSTASTATERQMSEGIMAAK
jgi:SecD/SecF fusion protein